MDIPTFENVPIGYKKEPKNFGVVPIDYTPSVINYKKDQEQKQETINKVNIADVAYIKGLLYALVSRVGKLESKTKDNTKDKGEEIDYGSQDANGQNGTEEDPIPEPVPEPTVSTCNTRAVFNCNTDEGIWEKGSFTAGCTLNAENNGWVHNGNSITFTKSNVETDCSTPSADSNCTLALYGLFYLDEAPDSMLEFVKINYPCQKEGESSEESSSSSADESSDSNPEPDGTFTITTSNGSHTFYLQGYGQQTYNSGSEVGSRYYYVLFYNNGISFITCEKINEFSQACYAHTVTGDMSQGASGSYSSLLSDCYIPVGGGSINCSGEPYGYPITFTWNVVPEV